ncbi:unnamed protein product [Rotaria sp. Silwood1]|nr:unnamed protein product [Rotaria sp. Silwood1]
MSYRYYLTDLCQMIEEIYIKNKPRQKHQIVYRADKIKPSELDAIKLSSKNKDKDLIISMNGFVSTTTDKAIAELYAKNPSTLVDFVSILYEITINEEI